MIVIYEQNYDLVSIMDVIEDDKLIENDFDWIRNIEPSHTLTLKKGDKLMYNVWPGSRWRKRTVHEIDYEYITFKLNSSDYEKISIELFDRYIKEGRVKKRKFLKYKPI